MTAAAPPPPASPLAACPVCAKPGQAKFKPFCSKRCADVDLHRWLGGVYKVETDEAAESDLDGA